MSFLYYIIIFIFVLVCLSLVGIILLQSSKTGGMGAAIGGQAMNEAFGGEGADKLLVRLTGGLAFSFMFLAILIGWIGSPESTFKRSGDSIIASMNQNNNQNQLFKKMKHVLRDWPSWTEKSYKIKLSGPRT